jgi:hypothetical protein
MVQFEHLFWLQILGDHSRFILDALSPRETVEIEKAERFIKIFDSLLDEARGGVQGTALSSLSRRAYQCAMEIREFKLHLLRRHLTGQISFNLSPTFLNHMLNELEEYIAILCHLLSGHGPVFHPIHHHLLWLSDGAGHAAAIVSELDETEKFLIEKGMIFEKDFEKLYNMAREMEGYLRSGFTEFPSLSRLNILAEGKMNDFMEFLCMLEKLRTDDSVLGKLSPLMADHMSREECYYLTKLSMVSEAEKPDCNPGRPRVQS